jgi:hypothetical protein
MPADGFDAAAKNRDLGTSRWQLPKGNEWNIHQWQGCRKRCGGHSVPHTAASRQSGSASDIVKPTRLTRFGRPIQTLAPEHAHTIAYNAEATDAARKDVVEFLSKLFNK